MKKQTGQLIRRKDGKWSGRYRTTVDGEEIRVCTALGTDNKAVARIKLAKLIAGTASPDTVKEASVTETFREAAERIIPTKKNADAKLRSLENHVFPTLGNTAVTDIDTSDIEKVLSAAGKQGLSKVTVTHVLVAINGVFDKLWRHKVIAENPVERLEMPEDIKDDDVRPRVRLTDSEFSRLLDYLKEKRKFQLHIMCLTARCFGGMRTSDLHAWDWSHIDTLNWATAYIPRPKTSSRDRLDLPEIIVADLQDWWERSGKPAKGPVFPRKASKSGYRYSYAERLRTACWAAGVRRGATLETCELQTDTEETRRLDMHSFRRAYNTGLAAAGVNVQLSMKLAGHRSPKTHMKYVGELESIATPEAALPLLTRAPEVSKLDVETPSIQQLLSQTMQKSQHQAMLLR